MVKIDKKIAIGGCDPLIITVGRQGVKDDHRGPEAFESHPQYTGRGLWNVEEGGRLACKCPQTPSLLVRNGLSDEARHWTRAHVTD